MKYVCPLCGSSIGLRTSYSGWDWEAIDENTGGAYKIIEAERTEIFEAEFECDSCDWVANEFYFEDLEDVESE